MRRDHSRGKIMLMGEKGRGSYNQDAEKNFEILRKGGRDIMNGI